MVFENGVKNIQAAAYNGANTVRQQKRPNLTSNNSYLPMCRSCHNWSVDICIVCTSKLLSNLEYFGCCVFKLFCEINFRAPSGLQDNEKVAWLEKNIQKQLCTSFFFFDTAKNRKVNKQSSLTTI